MSWKLVELLKIIPASDYYCSQSSEYFRITVTFKQDFDIALKIFSGE